MATISHFIRWADNTKDLTKNLQEGLDQVEALRSSADKMAKSLGGENMLRAASNMAAALEKIGGTSKLTAANQERVNDLMSRAVAQLEAAGKGSGQLAQHYRDLANATKAAEPPTESFLSKLAKFGPLQTMVAGALSVTAIVNFGRQLLADADALDKMSARTGIGVVGLQRLQVAGDDAGNTIEEMSAAINKMQDNLVGGDAAAVGALQKLNINLQQFMAMSPDRQFMAVSDALRAIQDPAQQVNIAIDLFGRTGASVLPTLKRGFDDVKNAAVGMSEDTVATLDKAGDALDKYYRRAKAALGNVAAAFIQAGLDPMGVQAAAREQQRFLDSLPTAPNTAGGALTVPGVPSDINDVIAKLDAQAAATKKIGDAAAASAKHFADLRAQVFGLDDIKHANEMVQAIGGLSGVTKMSADEQVKLHDLMNAAIDAAKRNGQEAPIAWYRIAAATQAATENVGDYRGVLQAIPDDLRKIADQVKTAFLPSHSLLGGKQTTTLGVDQGKGFDMGALRASGALAGSTFAESFSAALGPGLMSAVTGGGNILQGVGSALGNSLTGGLFGKDGPFDASKWSGAFGKLFGSLAPGIGALAGPLISAIAKLFGPSEAYKTVMAKGDWERTGALAQAQAATWADTSGRVKAALDAAYSTNRVEDFRAAVAHLNEEMAAVSAEQLADHERLIAAMQKYGLTIEDMGAKFQQTELDKQAKDLIQDWTVLAGAGADVSLVNEKMASSIGAYLNTAMTTGTEIPRAFKPIIDSMIKQGLLLDENGLAISDTGLLNIKWADSMTEGFDRVVSKLDELILKLQGTGEAINAIPKTIDIVTNYSGTPIGSVTVAGPSTAGPAIDPSKFAVGGFSLLDYIPNPTPSQLSAFERNLANGMDPFAAAQKLHSGGKVLPFVRAHDGWNLAPDEVPTILQTGERVLSRSQNDAYERGANMSGVENRLDRLERTLLTVIPAAARLAGRHSAATRRRA